VTVAWGKARKKTRTSSRGTHLGNKRTIWIREPERAPANLTVFLDAELYRERVGALPLADDLDATGAIDRSLFVFVSMESVAARWLECPCYPPFARFIDEEFFPWLEQLHPTVRHARERVIVGLSYTGLAAVYVAMMAPFRFTKVVAQSGSFWWNDCGIVGLFQELETKPKTEFYVDVGLRETTENVRHKEDVLQVVSQIEGVRRFREVLLRHGYTPRYVEFDGGHECAAWSVTLPGALRWALPLSISQGR
jgi:enterochelin esterase-like enzyme